MLSDSLYIVSTKTVTVAKNEIKLIDFGAFDCEEIKGVEQVLYMYFDILFSLILAAYIFILSFVITYGNHMS